MLYSKLPSDTYEVIFSYSCNVHWPQNGRLKNLKAFLVVTRYSILGSVASLNLKEHMKDLIKPEIFIKKSKHHKNVKYSSVEDNICCHSIFRFTKKEVEKCYQGFSWVSFFQKA